MNINQRRKIPLLKFLLPWKASHQSTFRVDRVSFDLKRWAWQIFQTKKLTCYSRPNVCISRKPFTRRNISRHSVRQFGKSVNFLMHSVRFYWLLHLIYFFPEKYIIFPVPTVFDRHCILERSIVIERASWMKFWFPIFISLISWQSILLAFIDFRQNMDYNSLFCSAGVEQEWISNKLFYATRLIDYKLGRYQNSDQNLISEELGKKVVRAVKWNDESSWPVPVPISNLNTATKGELFLSCEFLTSVCQVDDDDETTRSVGWSLQPCHPP